MRCFAMILSLRFAAAEGRCAIADRCILYSAACTGGSGDLSRPGLGASLGAALRAVLRLGVGGGRLVFARAISPGIEADGVTGEGGERSGAAELRALHGQREQRLQRGAVEILEHVEPPAPVGQIEIADDARDLHAVIR